MISFKELATALVEQKPRNLTLYTPNRFDVRFVTKNYTTTEAVALRDYLTASGYSIRVELYDVGEFMFEEVI